MEDLYVLCRETNVLLGIATVMVLGGRVGKSIMLKKQSTVHGMMLVLYVAVVSYEAWRDGTVRAEATEASLLIFVLNITILLVNAYQAIRFESDFNIRKLDRNYTQSKRRKGDHR